MKYSRFYLQVARVACIFLCVLKIELDSRGKYRNREAGLQSPLFKSDKISVLWIRISGSGFLIGLLKKMDPYPDNTKLPKLVANNIWSVEFSAGVPKPLP